MNSRAYVQVVNGANTNTNTIQIDLQILQIFYKHKYFKVVFEIFFVHEVHVMNSLDPCLCPEEINNVDNVNNLNRAIILYYITNLHELS